MRFCRVPAFHHGPVVPLGLLTVLSDLDCQPDCYGHPAGGAPTGAGFCWPAIIMMNSACHHD